jgi:predicted dithiol-disulfide oxidoreductase (DUF899 family)
MSESVEDLQKQIFELMIKLREAQAEVEGQRVPDYEFETCQGQVKLSELFGSHQRLLLIHNMGQGCRYCTLWADGFNGFVPHLEDALGFAVVSKDPPATQRLFSNSRGWRFKMASHGGGDYLKEQMDGKNMPGAASYVRRAGEIYRTNSTLFGPGDIYCPMWSLLALAGLDESSWTPQFSYWGRPQKLDDGGANVR